MSQFETFYPVMYIMFNHPRLYRKVLAFCNSCYSRSPSIDPATYHDVFALFYTSLMNGFVCSYCGCEMDLVSDDHQVSVDHVVPLARGGTNDITNLVLCCRHCNTQKASMTVEQWTAKRRSETVSRQQQAAIEDAIQDLQEKWRSHAGQFAWQREELVQPS